MNKYGVVLLLLLLVLSCDKDDMLEEEISDQAFTCEVSTQYNCNVPAKYARFVNDFFTEAEKYGVSLPKGNLEIVEKEIILLNGVAIGGIAYWNYNGSDQRRIEIANGNGRFDKLTEVQKEILMFHELGHAMLKRQHSSANLSDCIPASIMCGSPYCNWPNFYLMYTSKEDERRPYYLAELFNQCSETPSWLYSNILTTNEIVRDKASEGLDWEISGLRSEDYELAIVDSLKGFPNKKVLALKMNAKENRQYTFNIRFQKSGIPALNFNTNELLRLKTAMKLDQLNLRSLDLTFLAQDQNGQVVTILEVNKCNKNTLDLTSIDFESIERELYCIPNQIDKITYNLSFSGVTSGQVYFDDVIIEVGN